MLTTTLTWHDTSHDPQPPAAVLGPPFPLPTPSAAEGLRRPSEDETAELLRQTAAARAGLFWFPPHSSNFFSTARSEFTVKKLYFLHGS